MVASSGEGRPGVCGAGIRDGVPRAWLRARRRRPGRAATDSRPQRCRSPIRATRQLAGRHLGACIDPSGPYGSAVTAGSQRQPGRSCTGRDCKQWQPSRLAGGLQPARRERCLSRHHRRRQGRPRSHRARCAQAHARRRTAGRRTGDGGEPRRGPSRARVGRSVPGGGRLATAADDRVVRRAGCDPRDGRLGHLHATKPAGRRPAAFTWHDIATTVEVVVAVAAARVQTTGAAASRSDARHEEVGATPRRPRVATPNRRAGRGRARARDSLDTAGARGSTTIRRFASSVRRSQSDAA